MKFDSSSPIQKGYWMTTIKYMSNRIEIYIRRYNGYMISICRFKEVDTHTVVRIYAIYHTIINIFEKKTHIWVYIWWGMGKEIKIYFFMNIIYFCAVLHLYICVLTVWLHKYRIDGEIASYMKRQRVYVVHLIRVALILTIHPYAKVNWRVFEEI